MRALPITYYRITRGDKKRKPSPGRSPRGYAFDRSGRRIPDEKIKEGLIEAITGVGYAYGYLKLTHHLRREYGLIIKKKKVYRLCHELGILRPQRSLKPKRRRRIARNRIITGSNQLFETDIKYGYIHGENRFFYIQAVIDVYDRVIVDYHIGLSCTGRDAALTLQNVRRLRGPKNVRRAVIRTDNGPQFVSETFRQMCQRLGMIHELILEMECLACHDFRTYAEAYEKVVEFIKHYNERRIHSSLGYCTPQEIYEACLSNTARLKPIPA